jgi:hypothetical protein
MLFCFSQTCEHPCFNRGTCVNGKCSCPSGFVGFDCSLKKCGDSMCSAFGGSCEIPGFKCKCASNNIVNPHCAYLSCGISRCFMTGGKCDSGSCRCNKGYKGSYCDQSV